MKIEPFTSFDDLKPNPIFHLRNGVLIGGKGIVEESTTRGYPFFIRPLLSTYAVNGRYLEPTVDNELDIIGVSYEELTTKEME